MTKAVKAMHTTSQLIFLESLFSDVYCKVKYKPVFSVSSSVISSIYMNIKLQITSKLVKVFSSSLGCCTKAVDLGLTLH